MSFNKFFISNISGCMHCKPRVATTIDHIIPCETHKKCSWKQNIFKHNGVLLLVECPGLSFGSFSTSPKIEISSFSEYRPGLWPEIQRKLA